jgi:peptidyl-prolyl cis-trans isomerase D
MLIQIAFNVSSFKTLMIHLHKSKVGDLGLLYPNQMVNHSMISYSQWNWKSYFSRNRFSAFIIKATDKQDGIRLATVRIKLEASEATSDRGVYAVATKFRNAK